MKFLCPNCKAKYQIPNERIQGRTLKMDCRRCKTPIVIRGDRQKGQGNAPVAAGPQASPGLRMPSKVAVDARGPSASTEVPRWHCSINDVPLGPMRLEEVARKIVAGALGPASLVWREGFAGWLPLGDVPELEILLRRRSRDQSVVPSAPIAPEAFIPKSDAAAKPQWQPISKPASRPIQTATPDATDFGEDDDPTQIGSAVDFQKALAEREAQAASVRAPKAKLPAPKPSASVGLRGVASPASGMPKPGLPVGGLKPTGLPKPGLPAAGLKGKGLPKPALPAGGLKSGGLPGAGLPGAGLPGAGLPGAGLPGAGLPGAGLPGAGLPGAGLPKAGAPAETMPAASSALGTTDASAVEKAAATIPAPEPSDAERDAHTLRAPPSFEGDAPEVPEAEEKIATPQATAEARRAAIVVDSESFDPAVAESERISHLPRLSVTPAASAQRRQVPVGAYIAMAGAVAFGVTLALVMGKYLLAPPPAAPVQIAASTTESTGTRTSSAGDLPLEEIPEPVPEPDSSELVPASAETEPSTADPSSAPGAEPESANVEPSNTAAGTQSDAHRSSNDHSGHRNGHGRRHGRENGSSGSSGRAVSAAEAARLAQFSDQGSGGPVGLRNRVGNRDPLGQRAARNATGLEASQISAVVRRGRRSVQQCYERMIRGQSGAPTVRLDVEINVQPSGRVRNVVATGDASGELKQCVTRSVRRWIFPRSGTATRTSVPLVFTAQG